MVNIFNDPGLSTPPDANVEGGIVESYVIDPADIRRDGDGFLDLGIKNGVVTKINMKRKGTYHGKRYDRPIQKFTYK